MPNILVVDDELSIRESFALILEDKYHLFLAASGEAALKIAADNKVDLAFLDIRMPGLNGLQTLKRLKEINPDLSVIMVTAVNDIEKASQAIKLGALDYTIKPFDVASIIKLVEQTLRKKALQGQGKKFSQNLDLIGNSPKIKELKDKLKTLSQQERVLITGERGTEKTLIAKLINQNQGKSQADFFVLNLKPQEDEKALRIKFLGQTKGTSIFDLKANIGLLEKARSGSLLINNIENLPVETVKLIASGKLSRLGNKENKATNLSCQLIGSASSSPTKENKEVFEFFGQNIIEIPPLRERTEDLPLLINNRLNKYNQKYGRQIKFSNSALSVMYDFPWPGNLEQLSAIIEHLIATSQEQRIEAKQLPFDLLLFKQGIFPGDPISNFEKAYINKIFQERHQNKKQTAEILGITPLVLETKL